jgi:hypothetical protein
MSDPRDSREVCGECGEEMQDCSGCASGSIVPALQTELTELRSKLTAAEQRAAEAEAKFAIEAKTLGVLICCTCSRLWADDPDSDSESCDCGRFKQRMEWASAQQIEDRDTAIQHRADTAEARCRELEAALAAEHARYIVAEQSAVTAVRELVDSEWKNAEQDRLKVTDDAHDEATKWKLQSDWYGWNFHEGKAAGTIEASFIYHRMVRAIADAVKVS